MQRVSPGTYERSKGIGRHLAAGLSGVLLALAGIACISSWGGGGWGGESAGGVRNSLLAEVKV